MARAAGPVWLAEVEVGRAAPNPPERALDGRPYAKAAVAVRLHGVVIGVVELPLAGALDGNELAERATAALQAEIDEHLRRDGLDPRSESHGSSETVPRCRNEHRRSLERAPSATIV